MVKKSLGQYFTTNPILLQKVCDLTQQFEGPILEPSRGAGHIIQYLCEHGRHAHREWVSVEIDPDIELVIANDHPQRIRHITGDFLQIADNLADQRFQTIVGNPPYIRRKGACNIYIEFLSRCIDLLSDDGEMIMIIPTDFFTATSAKDVRMKMRREGHVTHIYRPDNENLFESASQDVIVLRFQKGIRDTTETLVNDEVQSLQLNDHGVFTFSGSTGHCLEDIFDIKVGMVSGMDDVFRNEELGNVPFYSRNGEVKQYIFMQSWPDASSPVTDYLLQHKDRLLARKIRKFNDKNWFQWGAVRNLEFMEEGLGEKPCIYMETLTRKNIVAHLGVKMHFDGNLLCLCPKHEMDQVQLEAWVEYFNAEEFQKGYIQSGRFKIGQRILCSAYVPPQLSYITV